MAVKKNHNFFLKENRTNSMLLIDPIPLNSPTGGDCILIWNLCCAHNLIGNPKILLLF